jgi:hypothetical protein
MLRHYGVVAMPCRVADPDRKGKVESGVGHAQMTPLKGLRFESPQEAQAYLDHWEARWADTRIHGTTKRQVAAMFAEERPALLPLPVEPFRYYQYGERTVHLGEIYRPLALAVHLKEGELEYYRGRLESSRDCLTYFQQNESALPNGSGRMRFRSRECGPVLAGSVQWRRQQSVRTAHTRRFQTEYLDAQEVRSKNMGASGQLLCRQDVEEHAARDEPAGEVGEEQHFKALVARLSEFRVKS